MDDAREEFYQEMLVKYSNKECTFSEMLRAFTDDEFHRYIAELYLEKQEPELVKGSLPWLDNREYIINELNKGNSEKYIVGACFKNIEDYERIEECENWKLWHPEEMKSSSSFEEEEGYDEFSEEHNKWFSNR